MLSNKLRQISQSIKRSPVFLSNVRYKAAYEGEGKTTVRVINQEQDLGLMIDSYATLNEASLHKVINQEQDLGLMIDSYATYGFRLNNGITVLGPIAIFSRTILSWQVRTSKEITEASLRFFKLLEPKIDLLIIGLETSERHTLNSVFRAAREAKLNVEILPTEHACSTFNFLNSEARSIAGALIPPLHIQINEDDMLRSKLHYEDLYKKEIH